MGKFANQAAYREYERQQNKAQDDYFEPSEPLTEFEKAAQWDDWRAARLDAELDYFTRVQ